MSYTPTTWTTGDTITATKLNKMEQGIADGGGYDLVLSVPYYYADASDVEIIEGDILECEQKIANDEPVNAVLVVAAEWSSTPSGANAPNENAIAKLTYWSCPSAYMTFSSITGFGTTNIETRLDVYNISYDTDDGSILAINHPYTMLIE